MATRHVLLAGQWQAADATGTFEAENPATRTALGDAYPVSSWSECHAALDAAVVAFDSLARLPNERRATMLEAFATRIESRAGELVDMAHQETALPAKPRLAEVELPRTTNQLRLAAAAARDGSWRMATIDTKLGIRSCYSAIGPVWVFGPNNFPFAFNSVAGGDFAAAIAAGNPVIAKSNTSHPGTTRILAEAAHDAVREAGLPAATVQMIYRTSHADGARAVADPRTGATAYTGSRAGGLALKAAADAAGKPIYLELSSVNPVVILSGALAERGAEIAGELTTSCLMGTGQFCTSPGLIILIDSTETRQFVEAVRERLAAAPTGALLSRGVAKSLAEGVETLRRAGAEVLVGGNLTDAPGYSYANTVLRVSGETFIKNPHALQTEAFGNASLLVVARHADEAAQVIDSLEGNLTGCIYSHRAGNDDPVYEGLARRLRRRVGRLLNDKMPTGVAVSAAMNHGGPFPATGHPGFTAVGIPGSLRRFAALECFDNVRPHRLPRILQDAKTSPLTWRSIDGAWTQGPV